MARKVHSRIALAARALARLPYRHELAERNPGVQKGKLALDSQVLGQSPDRGIHDRELAADLQPVGQTLEFWTPEDCKIAADLQAGRQLHQVGHVLEIEVTLNPEVSRQPLELGTGEGRQRIGMPRSVGQFLEPEPVEIDHVPPVIGIASPVR